MLGKEIAIVGYSGHGFVVADVAISNQMNLLHYVDKNRNITNPFSLNYLGFEQDPDFFKRISNIDIILGIGDNRIREAVFNLFVSHDLNVLNVIHHSCLVSKDTSIGRGNFLSKNVVVNPMTTIGSACVFNTGAIIEHDCRIGDSVHIAPGAVLAGNVIVGDRSFIGANAVVKEGIRIGENSIVGAGSVVVKDVPNNVTVYGNPAKV